MLFYSPEIRLTGSHLREATAPSRFAIHYMAANHLPRATEPTGAIVAVVFLAGGFDYLSPDTGPLSPVRALGGVLVILYLVAMSAVLLRQAPSV